uniref:Farnesyl pyrophosphate synthase n=1 Tax=Steinernema glaseri TaxID=37863 RepID=A0A1I7ZAZ5_9BILA
MATKAAVEHALVGMRRVLASRLTSGMHGVDAERARKRIENLVTETVMCGKKERSRLLVDTYMALEPEGDFEAAARLSTSMELMQSFFLVIDDVMDQSVTRRGKPCWYRRPGIGLGAINDGLLLDTAVDLSIRTAIPNHPNKDAILAALAVTKRKTVVGQLIDNSIEGLGDCNWSRYAQLVEHKTSHYSYFCPVELAMLLADVSADVAHVQKICYDIGYLFQSQDDYLDVFGDETVTGKVGTDLKEGKCTWVTCRALEKAPPEEKKILQENFGKSDDASVANLKTLVKHLRVDDDFQKFQTPFVMTLEDNIRKLPTVKLRGVLLSAVERIVNRKK